MQYTSIMLAGKDWKDFQSCFYSTVISWNITGVQQKFATHTYTRDEQGCNIKAFYKLNDDDDAPWVESVLKSSKSLRKKTFLGGCTAFSKIVNTLKISLE
jgi:hypothetical protein